MAFPTTHNLTYYRGDTFEFNIDVKNQDSSNFDLSGFETYTFKIANRRGAGASQYTGTAVKIDPATVKCTITPTVGRTLAAGDYFYDVQITDTTPTPNVIFTILTGTLTVTDDVSGAV
jgi:hypothetical protein